MITYGVWMAIMEFFKDQNEEGRQCICNCGGGGCNGTYTNSRAYINEDGDFVLSEHTLQKLLEDYKYTDSFDMNSKSQNKSGGFYFQRYWTKIVGLNKENPDDIFKELVKKEYQED
jgi:hypothetical protein